MKYARPVDCDNPKTGDNIRMTDVVEIPAGQDADAWLTVMFGAFKEQWQASNEWFVQVWDGVQPSQQYFGGSFTDPVSYEAPDPVGP